MQERWEWSNAIFIERLRHRPKKYPGFFRHDLHQSGLDRLSLMWNRPRLAVPEVPGEYGTKSRLRGHLGHQRGGHPGQCDDSMRSRAPTERGAKIVVIDIYDNAKRWSRPISPGAAARDRWRARLGRPCTAWFREGWPTGLSGEVYRRPRGALEAHLETRRRNGHPRSPGLSVAEDMRISRGWVGHYQNGPSSGLGYGFAAPAPQSGVRQHACGGVQVGRRVTGMLAGMKAAAPSQNGRRLQAGQGACSKPRALLPTARSASSTSRRTDAVADLATGKRCVGGGGQAAAPSRTPNPVKFFSRATAA